MPQKIFEKISQKFIYFTRGRFQQIISNFASNTLPSPTLYP